jgi:hypothetical protein
MDEAVVVPPADVVPPFALVPPVLLPPAPPEVVSVPLPPPEQAAPSTAMKMTRPRRVGAKCRGPRRDVRCFEVMGVCIPPL